MNLFLYQNLCNSIFNFKSNTVSYYMTTYYKKIKVLVLIIRPKIKIKWTKQPKVIQKEMKIFHFCHNLNFDAKY